MAETFTENVIIDGSTDIEQLRVQGHSTQTDPLQAWENSAADVLMQVTSDGRLQIGDEIGTSTPDALLEAHRDESSSGAPKRGIHSLGSITNLLSDAISWVVAEVELLGSAGVSGIQTALRAKVTHANTGDGESADLRAGDFQAVNLQGALETPVGRAVGVHAVVTNGADAVLDYAIGVEGAVDNDVDGVINQAAAFQVKPSINDGTIETFYGLRVPNLAENADTYALHTGTGILHFGDAQELKVFAAKPTINPPANFIKMYVKLDEEDVPHLYAIDSSGTEYALGSAAGSGGEGWTPAELTTLWAWYKSDVGVWEDTSGTTAATDTSAVARWDDQSGANRHLLQSTSGLRPTFNTGALNSKPSLVFLEDWLRATVSNAPDEDYTLFIVLKLASQEDEMFVDCGKYQYAGGGNNLFVGSNVYGSCASYWNGNEEATGTAWHLHTVIVDDDLAGTWAGELYLDGSVQDTDTSTSMNQSAVASITVGASRDDDFVAPDIEIAEIIILNSVATTTEIQNVNDYIEARYGLTIA